MDKFVIIPDSACDLTSELQKRFGVSEMIMFSVTFPNGIDHYANSDWDFISQKEFYQTMKTPGIYKTGAPSPERYEVVFERYLKQGYDILSISISSSLSSAFNSSLAAAEYLEKKYPGRKVCCLDSLRYSTSILPLIIKASELKEQGYSLEETFNFLLDYRKCLHQSGTLDDLFYLARAKRISEYKAFFGTIIGVNAIGDVDETGKTTVLTKVKGWKKALQVSCDYIKETIIKPEEQIIIIANTNRKDRSLYFKELVETQIHPKEVLLTDVGLSCAPNIGPGLCGAYYYGKQHSNDFSLEKEIMQKIKDKYKN